MSNSTQTQYSPSFTLRLIEARVRILAEDRPDFRYHSPGGACSYYPTENNPDGCIVGAAVRSLGLTLDTDQYEGKKADVALCDLLSIPEVPNQRGQARDPYVRDRLLWIGMVQADQDGGRTWGESVERADEFSTRGVTHR